MNKLTPANASKSVQIRPIDYGQGLELDEMSAILGSSSGYPTRKKASKDYIKYWYPCDEVGTPLNVVRDRSGKRNNAIFGGSVNNPWKTRGRLSSEAVAGANVSSNAFFNMGTEFVYICGWVKRETPTSIATFMGNADLSADSGNYGVYLATRTAGGKIAPRLNEGPSASGGMTRTLADSNLGYFDGTWHHLGMLLDPTTGDVTLFRDHVLDIIYSAAYVPSKCVASTKRWFFGSGPVGDPIAGLELYGQGMWTFPASEGLPLNFQAFRRAVMDSGRSGIPANYPFVYATPYSPVDAPGTTLIAQAVQVSSRFTGMHLAKYPSAKGGGAASPAPTYGFSTVRVHDCGLEWYDIEKTDGVFDWARFDEYIDTYVARDVEVVVQPYGTPAFHATGLYSLVNDNNEQLVGAMCPAAIDKYQRFISALITRYNTDTVRNNNGIKKIKAISPWNEPKFNEIVLRLHYVTANKVGAFAVGDIVQGATQVGGQTISGTITAAGQIDGTTSYYDIKMASIGLPPFAAGDTVSKGANSFVITWRRCRYYWTGTAAQMAEYSRVLYQTAKAIDPSIIILSPDWAINANDPNNIVQHGNAPDGAGGTGKLWYDKTAIHQYNADGSLFADVNGYTAVKPYIDYAKAAHTSLGIDKGIWATECGSTSGYSFIDKLTSDYSRASVLKRNAAANAAYGVERYIPFSHENMYIGNPSTSAVISAALNEIYTVLSGKTMINPRVCEGSFYFEVNGETYCW